MGRRDHDVETQKDAREKKRSVNGITLDAGGLIALDRKDRRIVTLVARAAETDFRVTVPATALAQAMRNPSRQPRISRLIRQPGTDLIALDGPDATKVGLLLAKTGTSDIVDAHVAICATRAGQPVVTSDPEDLHRIAPELRLVVL